MKTPLLAFLAIFTFADSVAFCADAPPKPNIIVMLVDDMGFADLGCYGSEIPTPNLDGLAAGGVRFTQFYNTARCCPTRAALLTGLYPHQAGMGWMTTDHGPQFPGFRGQLLDSTVTIAEALKPAGYFTAMTGKWHLGQQFGVVPWERGFDRSLNAPSGGFYYARSAGNTTPQLFLNGRRLDADAPELPKNWYSTDLWTDFGLRFIDEALAAKKPFFLYLAHNAPHFPLQADPADIAKFRGQYRAGWDALSAVRHKKQLEHGVVDKAWQKAARPQDVPAWASLSESEKDHFDNLMAIYAACVWRMDRAVGTLVAGLKKREVFDDTLILFMSDNGGNAEGGVQGIARGPGALGSADSVVFCGESWAWMQNTPFRKFKHYNHEGGIATPLIAHWPQGIQARGEWRHEPAHVIDIMATCLDVAGANYPAGHKGRRIVPTEGASLRSIFANQPADRAQPIFWEHEGNAAVREGDWKLVRLGYEGPWELYNLKADRTEQQNLIAAQPAKAQALAAKWDAWAKRAQVKPWPDGIEYPKKNGNTAKTKKENAAGTRRASKQTHFELGPDADLRNQQAPDVANRGFGLVVKLDKPGADGVLVAQGGAKVGWVLFFEKGRLNFMVNQAGVRSAVSSADAGFTGAKQISASLAAAGAVKLGAEGKVLAEGKVDGLLPNAPVDGLQVGRDLGGSVGRYAAPFPFTGTIRGAALELHPR
jgi:arylsulfatase